MGLCPINLANLAKQKNKISRLNGLEIEFKDQKYQIGTVYKKQDQKARDKLYFKLLDIKQNRLEGLSHLQAQMIKVSSNQITIDNGVGQLRANLVQQGFKCQVTEIKENHQIFIELEEYPCKVIVGESGIQIEGTENIAVIKKVSEIVKKAYKLI